MQPQDRTILLVHQSFAYSYRLTDFRKRRRRQSWENTGRPMLLMSSYRCTERLFRTFIKIVATTAMSMHTHISGYNIHPFSINQFRTDQCQVTVSHFQYFIIPYQYRAFVQPTLRSKNLAVNNLS